MPIYHRVYLSYLIPIDTSNKSMLKMMLMSDIKQLEYFFHNSKNFCWEINKIQFNRYENKSSMNRDDEIIKGNSTLRS